MERDSRIEIEPTLWHAVERAAEADGASPVEFVNRAVIDRLAFTDPAAYFAGRAARARHEAILNLLDRAPDVAPAPGDELATEGEQPGSHGGAPEDATSARAVG